MENGHFWGNQYCVRPLGTHLRTHLDSHHGMRPQVTCVRRLGSQSSYDPTSPDIFSWIYPKQIWVFAVITSMILFQFIDACRPLNYRNNWTMDVGVLQFKNVRWHHLYIILTRSLQSISRWECQQPETLWLLESDMWSKPFDHITTPVAKSSSPRPTLTPLASSPRGIGYKTGITDKCFYLPILSAKH